MESNVIAVDLDGTMCETCWTPRQCLTAEPIDGAIAKVNEMSKQCNFIIIYTARPDKLIPATLKWLRKHNVKYDAICNNKMVADVYIDEKNKTFEEVIEDG